MFVSKIVLSILLFTVYVIVFARYFVEKYLRGGVMITRDEERADDVDTPGRHVCLLGSND